MAKKYNKLVRDNVPQIIENSDKKCEVETLYDDQHFLLALCLKLKEETGELSDAIIASQFESTRYENIEENIYEEFADILTVVETLYTTLNIDKNKLEEIKINKLNSLGGFKKRIYLKDVK